MDRTHNPLVIPSVFASLVCLQYLLLTCYQLVIHLQLSRTPKFVLVSSFKESTYRWSRGLKIRVSAVQFRPCPFGKFSPVKHLRLEDPNFYHQPDPRTTNTRNKAKKF